MLPASPAAPREPAGNRSRYGPRSSHGGADENYCPRQAFAAQAAAAGVDGLRYLVRHDPAQQLYGIALFSDPPAATHDRRWPCERDTAIPDDLIAEAAGVFGYRVLPTP